MRQKNKKSQPEHSLGVFLGPPNGKIANAEHRSIRPICRNKRLKKAMTSEFVRYLLWGILFVILFLATILLAKALGIF